MTKHRLLLVLAAFGMAGAAAQSAGALPAAASPASRPQPPAAAAPRKPRSITPVTPVMHYLPTKALTIAAGDIMMLPIQGKIVRLALGSGNLLSTTTVDANLLLIAEQAGSTSLLVWTRERMYSYQVTIVPKDLQATRAKVEALTRGLGGVTVEQVGAELVLSGAVHKEVHGQLAASLKGLPGVVFNLREDQGSAYTRSVLFRLHFIEIKRSLLENIGIDWAREASGPVFGVMGVASKQGVYRDVPRRLESGDNLLAEAPPFVRRGANTGGVFLGLAATLTSRIKLGINDGDVRVLASPELTARSGGKARLQVGGEVPIQQAGALGAVNVSYKPYGIILEIEPQIDADDVITARISSELSQIDPSVSTASVPGFLTRTTSTEVSLKSGEAVALSGLVSSEISSAVDRVPVLGKIPILGRLFRSDDFRSNKTELVVLLEPEIIAPGAGLAMGLRERGEAGKAAFEDKLRRQ